MELCGEKSEQAMDMCSYIIPKAYFKHMRV